MSLTPQHEEASSSLYVQLSTLSRISHGTMVTSKENPGREPGRICHCRFYQLSLSLSVTHTHYIYSIYVYICAYICEYMCIYIHIYECIHIIIVLYNVYSRVYSCVCLMCMWGCTCPVAHMEVRGQLCTVSFLLPCFCRFQG